jgi:ubiquinone/menaquinone biosynthesis C-methylase UbiE
MNNWNDIYKRQGEVQSKVLPVVVDAARLFQDKNCRKILDLGCGTGRHTIYLAQAGFQVWGVDSSDSALDITAKKASELELGNIELENQDMLQLSFPDGDFDGVLCIWTTGHGTIADLEQSVAEMHRVVRPGGLVIADFCSVEDETFGLGKVLEENTFIGGRPGEENIPHHYSTAEEIESLFRRFSTAIIEPVDYTYCDPAGQAHVIKAFLVRAEK